MKQTQLRVLFFIIIFVFVLNSHSQIFRSGHAPYTIYRLQLPEGTDISQYDLDNNPNTRFIRRFLCTDILWDRRFGTPFNLDNTIVYGYINGVRTRCMPDREFIKLYLETAAQRARDNQAAGVTKPDNRQKTRKELQIELAIPQGSFAESDKRTYFSSLARAGVFGGYRVLFPINSEALYWTINFGIMYNDYKKEIKDSWKRLVADADQYSLPKYLNIPMLAGLQYEIALRDALRIYGTAAAGLNVLLNTKYSFSISDYEQKETVMPSASFGLRAGAGVLVQDRLVLSVNYMHLGIHRRRYSITKTFRGQTEKESGKFIYPLVVSSLNISLSRRF